MEIKKSNAKSYLDTLYYDTEYICLCNYGLKNVPNLSKFKNLRYIDLSYNDISYTDIDVIPKSVSVINLEHNLIKDISIFKNFSNLNILLLNNNYIEKLYNLENLIKLEINNNYLTSLIDCPKNLMELHCKNNYITSLKYLPKKIQYLFTSNNNIILEDF